MSCTILLTLLLGQQADRALAQARTQVKMAAAPVISVTANVETAFPIRIEAAELPKRATLLIRGIPGTLALTEGRVFDSGLWFVPIADVPKLRVQASSQAAGLRSPLSITLVSLDGTVIAESRTILEVRLTGGNPAERVPTALQTSAETESTSSVITQPANETAGLPPKPSGKAIASLPEQPKPALPSKAPQPGKLSQAEEEQQLKNGQQAWDLNDLGGARLIFESLANRGSAAGAWRLAQTYDPYVLSRTMMSANFKPDAVVAAKWYAKAAAMGHEQARKMIAKRR